MKKSEKTWNFEEMKVLAEQYNTLKYSVFAPFEDGNDKGYVKPRIFTQLGHTLYKIMNIGVKEREGNNFLVLNILHAGIPLRSQEETMPHVEFVLSFENNKERIKEIALKIIALLIVEEAEEKEEKDDTSK